MDWKQGTSGPCVSICIYLSIPFKPWHSLMPVRCPRPTDIPWMAREASRYPVPPNVVFLSLVSSSLRREITPFLLMLFGTSHQQPWSRGLRGNFWHLLNSLCILVSLYHRNKLGLEPLQNQLPSLIQLTKTLPHRHRGLKTTLPWKHMILTVSISWRHGIDLVLSGWVLYLPFFLQKKLIAEKWATEH